MSHEEEQYFLKTYGIRPFEVDGIRYSPTYEDLYRAGSVDDEDEWNGFFEIKDDLDTEDEGGYDYFEGGSRAVWISSNGFWGWESLREKWCEYYKIPVEYDPDLRF